MLNKSFSPSLTLPKSNIKTCFGQTECWMLKFNNRYFYGYVQTLIMRSAYWDILPHLLFTTPHYIAHFGVTNICKQQNNKEKVHKGIHSGEAEWSTRVVSIYAVARYSRATDSKFFASLMLPWSCVFVQIHYATKCLIMQQKYVGRNTSNVLMNCGTHIC